MAILSLVSNNSQDRDFCELSGAVFNTVVPYRVVFSKDVDTYYLDLPKGALLLNKNCSDYKKALYLLAAYLEAGCYFAGISVQEGATNLEEPITHAVACTIINSFSKDPNLWHLLNRLTGLFEVRPYSTAMPNSFKLAGLKHRIVPLGVRDEKKGLVYGQANVGSIPRKVEYSIALRGMFKRIIVLHEIIHWINYHAGLSEDSKPSSFFEPQAKLLIELAKDNPVLWSWLNSPKLKKEGFEVVR